MIRPHFTFRMCAIAAAVVIAAFTAAAFADGKFFQQHTIANDPTIPSQRAIIAWRDGVETLVVESTVEGEGDAFAWILPLPAAPTSIAPCTLGTIATMQTLVQPKITGDRAAEQNLKAAVFLLIIAIVASIAIVLGQRRLTLARAVGQAVLTAIVLLLLAALFLPALSASRGSSALAVDVLGAQRIGSYDVTVIKADSGADICAWLSERNFKCSDAAARVIDDYARNDWCFAAAEIVRIDDGPATPHPLRVTFPADAPVYPMRLTGVDAQPLQLDLYVLANSAAACDVMKPWHCDRFALAATHHNLHDKWVTLATGETHNARIGHPELISLMWSNCVLTHLRARLEPSQMQDDIRLSLISFEPARHHVYSPKAAGLTAAATAFAFLALALPCVLVHGLKRRMAHQAIAERRIAPAIGLAILIGGAMYFCLPIEQVQASNLRSFYRAHHVRSALMELNDRPPASPIEDLRQHIKEVLNWSDQTLPTIDVPGAVRIEDAENGWLVTLYDHVGAPAQWLVTPEGKVQDAPVDADAE